MTSFTIDGSTCYVSIDRYTHQLKSISKKIIRVGKLCLLLDHLLKNNSSYNQKKSVGKLLRS